MNPGLIQSPQSVVHGEIIPLVRVNFQQLFYILSTEVSRNICLNCPANRNYKRPKVGRSGGESVGTGATNICIRILVHFSLVVGPIVDNFFVLHFSYSNYSVISLFQ